jgi:hypothetical protein
LSDQPPGMNERPQMAHLYGPAVRCKLDLIDQEITGLAPERVAPGHHGYPHASDLIRVKALRGRTCHQIALNGPNTDARLVALA